MGSVAKSFMRKGFLIHVHEEMRKYLTIYEEAVSHIWLCNRSFWISLYMRKIRFSFLISVQYSVCMYWCTFTCNLFSFSWWVILACELSLTIKHILIQLFRTDCSSLWNVDFFSLGFPSCILCITQLNFSSGSLVCNKKPPVEEISSLI